MAMLTPDAIHAIAHKALLENDCDEANAQAIARSLRRAEENGAHSHGLFRLPGYIKTLRSGGANGHADPQINMRGPGVLHVEGMNGFAPLALERARAPLAEMARKQGVALCALTRIHHIAALWPEVEMMAEEGLCALAMTAALPYVAPAGGDKALFGTNPIAFAWPRAEGPPLAFDLAASTMARGEISIAAREGREVPLGVGLDAQGQPTTDPAVILNGGVQLAFGGYKGSALALMVELLAGALIGERFSYEALEAPSAAQGAPLGGEFLLAIDPARASGGANWRAHGEALLGRIEAMEGARLPGARRHALKAKGGAVEVADAVLAEIEGL